MVAVRTTGLAFDSIIGYQTPEGSVVSTVDEQHLRTLVQIANVRFRANVDRTDRFSAAIALQKWVDPPGGSSNRKGGRKHKESKSQRSSMEKEAKD